MSMVLKTELDRLVQPVQSGNGYQFGSVKMPKIVSITCQNREPKANPVLPLVQFLKSWLWAKIEIYVQFLLYTKCIIVLENKALG